MSTSTTTQRDSTYDVALSFAGEQREYVNRVALSLRDMGVHVFYDRFEEDVLWGKNLYDYLHHIYSKCAQYTVVFISRDYGQKLWTSHERKSAQERAFRESREYILPARFDDTSIPGIGETTGYIDCTKREPEQLAYIIAKKIGKLPASSRHARNESFHIHFRDISFSHETFLGVLVHEGARGWCIASNEKLPEGAICLSDKLSILPNEGEAFRERQERAISTFVKSAEQIAQLSLSVGCPIRILSPMMLGESTFERFLKTDRQYILKEKWAIQPFVTPVPSNPDSCLVIICAEDDDFVAYSAPADYIRDAFGIEIHRDKRHDSTIVFRESTFLRNAKFIAIDAETNRFMAVAGVDRELQLTSSVNSRLNIVQSIQKTIAADRKPVKLRSASFVVESNEQKIARESKIVPKCARCLDTREMVVSHNLRLYRVPCPDCNSEQNRSWSAFFSPGNDQQ